MVTEHLVQAFGRVALSPDPDLAVAALMIARLEYPRLDARPYIDELDAMGRDAAARVAAARPAHDAPANVDPQAYARITALSDYLFRELRFVGNTQQYEDPRNSFLNEVLERRTGIPITLAVVYMEVARRAGIVVEGVNFPGHFLVRCPIRGGLLGRAYAEGYADLIIDAFHGGALLSENGCLELLRRHAGEGAIWNDSHLRARATKAQILARMLVNLKRLYVQMYSFPQAHDITELLLAVDPASANELRDRGLLAYHLNNFSGALRDLQEYLRISPKGELDEEGRIEQAQIWEHIKTLRRRVASLN
jgi:regulator of sirC expression with transglutaminase-like and TPR domain